jgi:hypothetical protein
MSGAGTHLASCLAAIVSVCAMSMAPPAHAQEDRDAAFKAGLDARDNKKWPEAVEHMRRAIQSNPREDTRKVARGLLGVRGRNEYLPHYFLGEALFHLGDCQGAVDAWSTSQQQGAVATRSDYVGFLQKGYAECEEKGVLSPGKYNPLLARANQHLSDAMSQAAAISERGKSNLSLWRADASLSAQYDRASGELQNAQSRLASAKRTRAERDFTEANAATERARGILATLAAQLDTAIARDQSAQGVAAEVEQTLQMGQEQDRAIESRKALLTPPLVAARQAANVDLGRTRSQLIAAKATSSIVTLNEMRSLAQDALGRLRRVLEEIAKIEKRAGDTRLTEALSAAQEGFSFVDGAFATLDARAGAKPSAVTPGMTLQRDALKVQYAALRRRFEAARRASNAAAIEQAMRGATDIRAQLDAIIALFGPVTIIDRGVRPELAEGARLFFAGDYEQVLAWLEPARLGEIPLQLHMHLFRGAALYALYVRSGETDQARRAAALAEIEACKRLNPTFEPDPRAFAPRFISFFHTANAPAPPTGTPRS